VPLGVAVEDSAEVEAALEPDRLTAVEAMVAEPMAVAMMVVGKADFLSVLERPPR
jgi:hypothetical protein